MTIASRPHAVHRVLGAAALVLAMLAAALPESARGTRGAMSALDLARWIRDGKPRLRVIDLRDSAAFETFHIPGAVRMTLDDVARARWAPDETVVLYGEDEAEGARGRANVRSSSQADAHVLAGGVNDWARTVIAPTLPVNPSPAQAAEWPEIAELSRWFGGVPRVAESASTTSDSLRASLGRITRRGC